jgi:hypothetical protein
VYIVLLLAKETVVTPVAVAAGKIVLLIAVVNARGVAVWPVRRAVEGLATEVVERIVHPVVAVIIVKQAVLRDVMVCAVAKRGMTG